MMKKIIFLAIAMLLVGMLSSQEMIFNTQDFPPFSYMEDGKVAGPAVDIITLICKEIEVKPKFNLLPWTRAQIEVEEGKANAMFVIGWNADREKWLFFSPPLLKTEYGFFVHTSDPLEYRNVEDVKGYTVGVYGPSNTSKNLEKIKSEVGDLKIDMTQEDIAAFKKLEHQRVQAVFSNKDVGNAIIKDIGLENVRYAGQYKSLNYFIGFSQEFNDKEIIDKFNTAFKNLHEEGKIKEILNKYNMKHAELK